VGVCPYNGGSTRKPYRSVISWDTLLSPFKFSQVTSFVPSPISWTLSALAVLYEDHRRYCRDLWLPCPFTDPLSLRPAQVNITFKAVSITSRAQCLAAKGVPKMTLHKYARNIRSLVYIVESSTCTCVQEKCHCRESFSCACRDQSVVCRQF
jgi:hypothetical protein